MDDSKELFDYWYGKTRLRNHELIEAPGHIETFKLRHECTNYDDLRRSREVEILDEPERSRIIAIIKYECTAKVLQHRASRLRDRANKLEDSCNELDQQRSKLLNLIRSLQEKLFGKDKELKRLEIRIAALEAENEALRADSENGKAEAELQAELDQLRKKYEAVEKRRQELAKNNQSLGGRVAHTKRYKQQRDAARAAIEEQKQEILLLTNENLRLQAENESLRLELEKLQQSY